MATQVQAKNSDRLTERNRIPWERLTIAMIILILAIVGTIIGVWTSHENWGIPIVVSFIFAGFGLIFVLLRWFLPLPYIIDKAEFSQTLSLIPARLDTIETNDILLTFPRIIQRRQIVVHEIYALLTRETVTSVVLTGMGGVGKSTLADLIFHYAEELRQGGFGIFVAEPIWITIDTTFRMADLAKGIIEALGRHIPHLDELTPRDQARELFDTLNTTGEARLIILDQFENLLDWQTGNVLAERPGIQEYLELINSQPCTCRVLLTSRSWPQSGQVYQPKFMQEFKVKGLEAIEGIELLHNLGVEETDEELRTAVEYCDGHPLALILMASLLRDYHLSLSGFFKDPLYTKLWVGDIAHNLLDHIYMQRLNELQRQLLLAFSIYREAVPLSAALALIDIQIEQSKVQVQSALYTLLTQHLLQKLGENHNEIEQGLYRVHNVVATYALDHFFDGNEQSNIQTLRITHGKAAQYYLAEVAKNYIPREQRRAFGDVHSLLEAFWHFCQANQWQNAYNLLDRENIFTDLKRWGGNDLLLEFYQQLLPLAEKSPKSLQAVTIYKSLGRVYRTLGDRELAREYLEQALSICQEIADRKGEGMTHSFLGSVYSDLGKPEQALEHLGLALEIRREIGDREGEGWSLVVLGEVYDDLGQEEQAREYLEQALQILGQVGARRGEERSLNTLGRIYDRLGWKNQALEYYRRALQISIEIGDRVGESMTLKGLGLIYAGQGQEELALEHLEKALAIQQVVKDRGGETRTLNQMSRIYRLVGRDDEAYEAVKRALSICKEIEDRLGESNILNQLALILRKEGQYVQALETLNDALSLSVQVGSRTTEGWTLHNLGLVCDSLGDYKSAQKYYALALNIRKEVGDRRGEAWSLCNIGMITMGQKQYEFSLACFLLARARFEEVKSPDISITQDCMDSLRQTLGEEQFSALLSKVEPMAAQIIERNLS